ncbi:MAG: hypothetical protein K6B74_06705 [Ruminococcus sp.]|nr:hypothetical protein [Ruminococcus sp.]
MMKGLFKKASAAAAAVVLSVSTLTTGVSAFGGVTETDTPTSGDSAVLKWVTRAAAPDDWQNAPGMPAIAGDEIVYICGTELCALDKKTGKLLGKKGTLASAASYGLSAPVYADGKIIVALSGGVVQAFDAETFESLWVYHDELGGQAACTVAYDKGYVYTGFWTSEADEANFVCIPTADTDPSSPDEEQAAAWTYTANGGYYWSGACITSNLVIFGTDNGDASGDGEGSKIVAVSKAKSISSGKAYVRGTAEGLSGDLRSGITKDPDSDYYYVTSKAKKLIRFKTDSTGKIGDVEELELPGMSSSTPIIANGRLYIGLCGSSAWYEYTGHKIAVIDTKSFKIAYTAETNGYCQSSALISESGGENYVYFTANMMPGNVYVLHDKPGMTAPDLTETVTAESGTVKACPVLFSPAGGYSQYCLSSVLADTDGTLIFKNDSNSIFAVAKKPVSIKADFLMTIYKEGERFSTDGFEARAVYADGTEKDITADAKAKVPTKALKAGSYKLEVTYEFGLAPDGTAAEPFKTEVKYDVLAADDFDNYQDTVNLIEELGEITEDSRADVERARKLYDSLSDTAKKLVYNYDDLTRAEWVLARLAESKKITFYDCEFGTDNSVKLSWRPVSGASSYQLFMYDNNGGMKKLADLRTPVVKLTGLKAGKEYRFCVKAAGTDGSGKTAIIAESDTELITAKLGQTKITDGKLANNGLLLTYTPSEGADGYMIQYYSTAANEWKTLSTVGAEHTKVKLIGIRSGKTYRFRVVPVKNTGTNMIVGDPSNEFETGSSDK